MAGHPSKIKIWEFIRKLAGQGGQLLKTAWLVIGATLLLILFLEVACGLIYRLQPAKTGSFYFPHSQFYQNAPWMQVYDKELFASYNTSWRPFVYWRRTPFQGKYININAQGLRYTTPGELRDSEASRKLKIFMFGGSTMWGEGVRDQFTLPSLVARDLAAHQIKAEVTNFGEVAYVNTQELIELIFQLERGNTPDVVIFYDGYNDVYAAEQNRVAGFSQFEWKRELEYNISSRYPQLKKVFLLNTLDRFYLGKLIKSLSAKVNYKKPFSQASKTVEKDLVEVYFNNLKIITALGKAYGFVPLFFWQPVIYTKNNLTDSEKPYATEPLGELYRQSHAVMEAEAGKFAPYNFYDISGLFAGAPEEIYMDYCHVNENANRLIARRITTDLLQVLEAHPARGRRGISGGTVPGGLATPH
jgi:lysophospholipase L1-like esterase